MRVKDVDFERNHPVVRRGEGRKGSPDVLTVTAVYLLVNLAFLYALPVARLASSTLPAADAAQEAFGGRTDQFVTVLALLSLPSLANG